MRSDARLYCQALHNQGNDFKNDHDFGGGGGVNVSCIYYKSFERFFVSFLTRLTLKQKLPDSEKYPDSLSFTSTNL